MESGARAEQASSIIPSLTPPSQTAPHTAKRAALPWRVYKAPPHYNITGVPRQRNMAQVKKKIKIPEKELSDEEINNLSAVEFKTLVIRMLTELSSVDK